MRIRAQINGLVVISAVVLPLALGIGLQAVRGVGDSLQEMAAAEDLIRSATQLRLVVIETIIYRDARARDQWQRKVTSLKTEMARLRVDSTDEKLSLGRIRNSLAHAETLYKRLHGTPTGAGAASHQPSKLDADLQSQTVSSLFVVTQEILDSGADLTRSNRNEAADEMRVFQWSILFGVMALGGLLLLVWRMVTRTILLPLRALEHGTGLIASGDYAHRLNLPQKDEIGELAAQFDQMSAHVQTTQQQLIQLSERLKLATEGARVGVWDYDLICNQLVWDDVMYSLYGITRETFGGVYDAWRAGVHPDDQANGDDEIAQARAGEKPFDTSFRVVWPSGEVRFIRAIATVQRDPGGVAVRMIGTNWDISEERKAEQAKAEFVSTVSHELRTPLTSIAGSLGLVVGGALGEVPTMMKPMLDIAHKNSLRLAHLIDDLLDMEKLVAGKIRFDFQVQELMPLIDQAVESTRSYGEQFKVRFTVTERTDDLRIRVDGDRLHQVLANFLSNAAKYSPTGGQVEITARAVGKVVRVSVTDHGPGIPQEFRSRIFQKFSQADSSDTRQKAGTGLGLAITKELIERMNGLIGFTSDAETGTCFHFELPIWVDPAARLAEEMKTTLLDGSANALPGALHLLVVEDEPDIAKLLAMMLNRAGYQVDVAHDGESALKHLAQRQYAAITLDLMLPDQSGVTVMRNLRSNARTEKLPIIVVSAYVADGQLAINGEFNAIDWIEKPFDESRLVRAVKRAIENPPPTKGHAQPEKVGPLVEKCHVLHIEDDADLSTVIATLGQDLAEFSGARTVREARVKLAANRYQLVVLDIGLPDGSGWELLPQLRALVPPPAVIVLSGTDATPEQEATVRAVLNKSSGSTDELLALFRQLLP